MLETLREPLESGSVTISRASRQASFPARFQLVAAMNPCPCGTLGDPAGTCRCTEEQVARYRSRVSGPLLDRIDLHVEVPRLHDEEDCALAESSAAVRERVAGARAVQIDRAEQAEPGAYAVSELRKHCAPAPGGRKLARPRDGEAASLGPRARPGAQGCAYNRGPRAIGPDRATSTWRRRSAFGLWTEARPW